MMRRLSYSLAILPTPTILDGGEDSSFSNAFVFSRASNPVYQIMYIVMMGLEAIPKWV